MSKDVCSRLPNIALMDSTTGIYTLVEDLKVTVVDYDSGNLRSVSNALKALGIKPNITNVPTDILSSDAVILPGVGSGATAMKALRRRQLVDTLREYAAMDRPFMGVCLGLQLLMDSTEEGNAQCLGIVPGTVKSLPPSLKVPHMGWNSITPITQHSILDGIPPGSYFYFVHSYYATPEDQGAVVSFTEHGINFCSILSSKKIIATQFHPEKSGPLGLMIYANFLKGVRQNGGS